MEDKTKKQLISELKSLKTRCQKLEKELRESKRAEEALRKNEERFRAICEYAPVMIDSFNEEGRCTLWNKECEKQLGYTKEEIIATEDPLQLFYPDSQMKRYVLETIVNKDGQFREFCVCTKGGYRYQMWANFALPDQSIISFGYDITETKQAEERLNILGRAIETNPSIVMIAGKDTVIEYVNPAYMEVSGFTIEETLGKNLTTDLGELTPKTDCQKMYETIRSGKVWKGTFRNKKKDGGAYYEEAVISSIKDKDNNITHYVKVANDVTERRQLETQFRQSQKMEAIGVLTGGIAHEFNNLLTPILGYTGIFIEDKPKNDPDLEGLEQIQYAGNRAKELVRQLLAYGRRSLSQRESIKLETLVDDTFKLIKNTIPSNIFINKEIEIGLPPILGMPNEIHQVLLNLCLNASHAMSEGGELTIRLKKKSPYQFFNLQGQKREGNFIVLSVQDTGAGIDQTIMDRIFDPFFTTKGIGRGSGLGLSVVQGIVGQHEGHIEVNSKVGEGTIFHVYFPIAQKEIKPLVVKTKSLSKGSERILLIDDEPMITNLAKKMLQKLGYKVTEFLDCEEALKLYANHPQDFDLVITDYGMTKMNGKQLAKRIKEIRPEIPVILLTGYGDLVTREDIHTWGMDDLLIKPLEFERFSEIIRTVLNSREI